MNIQSWNAYTSNLIKIISRKTFENKIIFASQNKMYIVLVDMKCEIQTISYVLPKKNCLWYIYGNDTSRTHAFNGPALGAGM